MAKDPDRKESLVVNILTDDCQFVGMHRIHTHGRVKTLEQVFFESTANMPSGGRFVRPVPTQQ